MSHLRVCELKIEKVNPEILRHAVEFIAYERRTSVVTRLKGRYDYGAQDVLAGVADLNYGVRVKGNKLEVVGDSWGNDLTVEQFTKQLTQVYTMIAWQGQLQRNGCQTQIKKVGKTYQLLGLNTR